MVVLNTAALTRKNEQTNRSATKAGEYLVLFAVVSLLLDENRRIVLANPACALLSLTTEQLVGQLAPAVAKGNDLLREILRPLEVALGRPWSNQ